LQLGYVGVVPDQNRIVKDKISRKYGQVGNNNKKGNDKIMNISASHNISQGIFFHVLKFRSIMPVPGLNGKKSLMFKEKRGLGIQINSQSLLLQSRLFT
jgi:hypothetical protein